MLRAVATRVRSSMSLAATAAARGSRGARVASLGTPRAFARPLVGGARVFARDRSLPRSPSTPPRRGAFRVSRRVSRRFVAATDDGAEPKPTPVASSVYAHPELYELAFGFRDFDSEAAFLARMCRAHAGRAMRSVLELGAGPAWHSVSCVTTQGPCVAVALDNTPAMLKRASQRALERGCEESVAVVAGDMTRLDASALKQTAQTLVPTVGRVSDTTDDRSNDDSPGSFAGFDVVTVLLGTAAHLTAPEDAEACLRGAADCLAPGGIVVLELEHPYDLFDGQLMDAHGDAWDREVENGGGLRVLVEWGREGDPFDVETQIVERTVSVNVVDENGRPPANGAFPPVEEVVRCRVFTAPEIALLGKLAGLRVVATFGDMDTSVPLTHEDANNMVIVLRRADDDETLRP